MKKEYVWTDTAAIDVFLNEQEIGHLTTIDAEGWPQTVPVNYLWQGGTLYFHSGLRGKIDQLRQNPKVAFAVTEPLGLLTSEVTSGPCHDTQLGRSVLIRGLAREVKSREEKLRLLNKIIAKYDPAAARDPQNNPRDPESLLNEPGFHGCLVVAVEVTMLTARQNLLDGKPTKYRQAVAAHFQKRGQELGRERDLKTAALLTRAAPASSIETMHPEGE